jgi:hypothetical protein
VLCGIFGRVALNFKSSFLGGILGPFSGERVDVKRLVFLTQITLEAFYGLAEGASNLQFGGCRNPTTALTEKSVLRVFSTLICRMYPPLCVVSIRWKRVVETKRMCVLASNFKPSHAFKQDAC